MLQNNREIDPNLFSMNGSDSNLGAWRPGGEQLVCEGGLGREEELTAEADTEELVGGGYKSVDEDGQESGRDDDPDGRDSLDDHRLDYFAELDHEVEQYVARLLNPMEGPSSTSRPLLQRILANLRSHFFSDGDHGQGSALPHKDPQASRGHASAANAAHSQADLNIVTCRICDMPIDVTTLDGHTDWCSKYQDGLLKKEKCAKYLHLLLESLPNEDVQLRSLVAKALEIDEEAGRTASVRLAKLLYKITKMSSLPRGAEHDREQVIKRLRYLVDQKRVLAERFLELKPALTTAPILFDASSGTDSSIDSTPSTWLPCWHRPL